MANPPVDLAETAFGVLVVGVLAAVAVAGSPRYDLGHNRAVFGEEKLVLRFQALEAAGGDVVLDVDCGRVVLRSSGGAFTHSVLFHREVQPVLPNHSAWR